MMEIDKAKIETLTKEFDFLDIDNPTATLAQQIYKVLLCLLLDNTLKPGTVLSRRELAEIFGVSVAPVLEALVLLERDGFIVTAPRSGTVVKEFSKEDLLDSLYIREAVECQAARMYCGRKLSENKDRLMPIAIAIDESYGVANSRNWINELKFHRALVELSGSIALLKTFSLNYQIGVFYTAYNNTTVTNSKEADSHRELLTKLEIDDPDFAERCIRQHLRFTIAKFKKMDVGNLDQQGG